MILLAQSDCRKDFQRAGNPLLRFGRMPTLPTAPSGHLGHRGQLQSQASHVDGKAEMKGQGPS